MSWLRTLVHSFFSSNTATRFSFSLSFVLTFALALVTAFIVHLLRRSQLSLVNSLAGLDPSQCQGRVHAYEGFVYMKAGASAASVAEADMEGRREAGIQGRGEGGTEGELSCHAIC